MTQSVLAYINSPVTRVTLAAIAWGWSSTALAAPRVDAFNPPADATALATEADIPQTHLPLGRLSEAPAELSFTPDAALDLAPNPVQLAQVTSVSELSDVAPSDWAFTALQRLVEEYGCIEGYPDRTFRGNRAMTRYEFSAGLNACMDVLLSVIAPGTEDFSTLAALQREFQAELSDLQRDLDFLEADVAELQANQFSTTTRLFGQVIFGLQGRGPNRVDFFPVDGTPDFDDPGTAVNTITSAQLSLISQLSPRGLLLTGLQAGSGSTAPRFNNDVRLAYEGGDNFNLTLSDLTYRHLVGDSLALIGGALGINPVSVFRGTNRVESAGSGPLSAFAQRNPIISIGAGSTGLGFDWQLAERISLQGVYTASQANDPTSGLFGSDTTIGFQVATAPTNNTEVALQYLNSYSRIGDLFTAVGDSQLTAGDPISTNAFGLSAAWDITPAITLGGWGGYTTSFTPGETGSVETRNWMAFLNFPDLGGPGHLGGIYLGQPPKITSSTLRQGQNIPDLLAGNLGNAGGQRGSTTHLEVFYRYQATDNISFTPGLIMIFEPANTPGNDTITMGVLRTTLSF